MRIYEIRVVRNRTVRESVIVEVEATDFQSACEAAYDHADDVSLTSWETIDSFYATAGHWCEEV